MRAQAGTQRHTRCLRRVGQRSLAKHLDGVVCAACHLQRGVRLLLTRYFSDHEEGSSVKKGRGGDGQAGCSGGGGGGGGGLGGEESSAGFGDERGGEGGAGGGGSNGEHEEHAEFVARDKGDCLTQDAGAY